MTRYRRAALLLILVGAFIPFFFRVGWGSPSDPRRGGFFGSTSRIVVRQAIYEADDDATGWRARWHIGREISPSIGWPAGYTDVTGLSLAFIGVLMLVLKLPALQHGGRRGAA